MTAMGMETPELNNPPPVRRMDGWSDGRYIIELEWVVHQQRKQLLKLEQIRALLAKDAPDEIEFSANAVAERFHKLKARQS